MTKPILVRDPYSGLPPHETTPAEMLDRSLSNDDYDRSDSDASDQAQRIDETRAAMGRLLDELHASGALSDAAVGRICAHYRIEVVETAEGDTNANP